MAVRTDKTNNAVIGNLTDCCTTMTATLGKIQTMLLAAEPLSREAIQSLLDQCNRQVTEHRVARQREMERINNRTYSDENEE